MNVTPEYFVVIPARYESERLPGKALLNIGGKSLIQRVWECAVGSSAIDVFIATDHEKISKAAESFGARVIMTANTHTSGSDRIAECAEKLGWSDQQLIVNLQGDEPLMPPECIEQVAALLTGDLQAASSTLYWPVDDAGDIEDPNVVKVVTDQSGRALMFSRSPIPYPRDHSSLHEAIRAGQSWKRHLGLYAYRNASLQEFSRTLPTPLEESEKLEQLRTLETGGTIIMAKACRPIPAGVDTLEDLERVRNVISS